MWRKIEADGCEWQVAIATRSVGGAGEEEGEVLQFRPLDRLRPPRQIAVRAGSLAEMDEIQLRAAYRKARPIGGDHYGRPGKRMTDTGA